jgi:radical SAM superfamily enzyme YgiQ (UPF0313 family)
MKVLLIHPPWLRLFKSELAEAPMGLGYIAAVLRDHGFTCVVYNADYNYGDSISLTDYSSISASYSSMRKGYSEYLKILQDFGNPLWLEIQNVIKCISPDIVGISTMTASFDSGLNVARYVRNYNPDIPIVFGGVHPTVLPEETLNQSEVDIVVRGEGEYVFLDLLEKINLGRISEVKGISYKKNDKIFHNPPADRITDLDKLPFYARDLLFDKEKFPPSAFRILMATRGCPYNCIYCSSPKTWQRKVTFRSPENVINEIIYVKDRYGTEEFSFKDDCLTINKKFIVTLCDLMIKEKINIQWNCQGRIDTLSGDIVKKMKQAGCTGIYLGIESGNNEILEKIRKRTTVEQAKEAVRLLKKYDIWVSGYFMFGFPWETETQMFDTIDFIRELDLDKVQYNLVVPYPGTELYSIVREKGLLQDSHERQINWSKFYQNSPDMFFAPNLSKSESISLIQRIENEIDQINMRKLHHGFRKRMFRRARYYFLHPRQFFENKLLFLIYSKGIGKNFKVLL